MNDIEANLRQTFNARLDAIEAGPLPAQVRSRARRGRALMLAVATLTSVALVSSAAVAVSALTAHRKDAGPIKPALSPHPIVSQSNGRIAYSAAGSGSMELRTVRPDGSDQTAIPTPDGDPWSHSWSRDGSKLAVVLFSPGGGPRTIWVMNPDGSDPRQIASSSHLSTPSWSPDGRTLAYSATTNRRTSIHLVDAAGGNDRIVHAEGAEGTFAIFSVEFSPDGTQLLFDRGTDSGFDIFVMDVDGTDVTQLTTSGTDYDPSWSPDGTRVVFTREDDSKADANTVVTSDIFVMNSDGSGIQRLTETQPGSTDLSPVWAPDGTKIAYVAGRTGGPGRVVVMNPDGSDPFELVDEEVLGISWQPQPTSDRSVRCPRRKSYAPSISPARGPDGTAVTIRGAVPTYDGQGNYRVSVRTVTAWWNLSQIEWPSALTSDPVPADDGAVLKVAEEEVRDRCDYEIRFNIPPTQAGSYPVILLQHGENEKDASMLQPLTFEVTPP